MRKQLLILLFLFAVDKLWSCPTCNIHNYLNESIDCSDIIYKGKIVGSYKKKKSEYAIVQIIAIIKVDTALKVRHPAYSNKYNKKVGDTDTMYYYNVGEDIGKELIFCNPIRCISPVKFEFLPVSYENEIKFLADSAAVITSTEQAIELVEGISWYSIKPALDYIEQHYEESFEKLSTRLQAYRQEALNNPQLYFAEFKITNLCTALLSKQDSACLHFILNEIDSIAKFPFQINDADQIPWDGGTIAGNYLETIFKLSKANDDFHKKVITKLGNYLKKENNTASMYIAFALSHDTTDAGFFKNLPAANTFNVALGLLYRASYNRWYNIREKEKTVQIAQAICSDKRLEEIIIRNNLLEKKP